MPYVDPLQTVATGRFLEDQLSLHCQLSPLS
jgi:hypothetical protein